MIGAAAILAFKCLYQALSLKTAEGFVERAGSQMHPRETLDVLGEGVAVLSPIGEARQDQAGRT